MNFQLVPKYKKYNKTLNQVFFVSVPPTESPESYSDDLPVPIRIKTYKQKHRKVLLRGTVSHLDPNADNKTGKLLFIRRKRNDSYDDSEKGCGLSRWCAKRRALKELEDDRKKQLKQAREWQNWKFQEAERVRRAEIEQERLRREAEYVKQLAEIEQQKRELIKSSSKTRYPFPTIKRKPPKESFKKGLPSDPYYPKKIELKSSYDYVVEKSQKEAKRELKRREREERKVFEKSQKQAKQEQKRREQEERKLNRKRKVQERDPYLEDAQHSKCSRIRTCLNNFCGSTKKKKEVKPYVDIYETDYSKPETSKKAYTDPYDKYYDKPKTEKPYVDPYEKYNETSTSKKEKPYTYTYDNYYDKPKKEKPYVDTYDKYYDKPKKEEPYTDPYQAYYDSIYDKPRKKKKRKDSISEAELYEQYYQIYGGKSNKKGKKRKDSELIVDKRTERGKYSRMFVNCFYRTCCECYCWFSVFLIIGVAIIMVI